MACYTTKTMKNKWLGWSILESFIRVAASALQKTIGALMVSIGPVLYGTSVMGLTQGAIGFLFAKITKQKIIVEKTLIIGSVMFGVLATICTICSFSAFSHGGQIGLHSFITTLGIIPGAVIDRLFFNHRFNKLQIFGIFIAIIAGYTAIGAPSLSELFKLPMWMLFSFLTMLGMAINQGISQKIQNINPLVKNFWGGMAIFLLAGLAVIFFGSLNPIGSYPIKIAQVSSQIAILGVLLWTVNLYAYKGGAFIAIKKLVVNGGLITISAIWGAMFFNENISIFHIVGFLLYCLGFTLVDKNTWDFIVSKIKKPTTDS